jgi:hypothetical protein
MCEHLRSRTYDTAYNGERNRAKRPYVCFKIRRRQCLDCGVKFQTAEIPLHVADSITSTKEELINDIKRYLYSRNIGDDNAT